MTGVYTGLSQSVMSLRAPGECPQAFDIYVALESGCTEIVKIIVKIISVRGMTLQVSGQAGCWGYNPLLIVAIARMEANDTARLV